MEMPRGTPETSLGSIFIAASNFPWELGSLTPASAVTTFFAFCFYSVRNPKWPRDSLCFQFSETIAVLLGENIPPLGTTTFRWVDQKLWGQEAKMPLDLRGEEPFLLPSLIAGTVRAVCRRDRTDSVYIPCPKRANSNLSGYRLPTCSMGNVGPTNGELVFFS